MNYEMKTINKTLVISWLSIIGILLLTYSLQVIKQERDLNYLLVFALIMIVPWILVFLVYKKKQDYNHLGYFIVIGYSLMYVYVLFTGATQMVSNYILPLLCFLILYHQPLLILFTFGLVLFINGFSLIHEFQRNFISASNIKEIEIRFATIVICFIGSYISAKVYDQIHKESENSLRAAVKAETANEAKRDFLASMSHEIRTPINAVLGMDTMILRETKEEKIKEYAMDIHQAGRTLLSLVNDILDISKIESGKMEIVPVDYDFSSLVNDTVNMIRDKAKNKGLSLEVHVDHDIPCMLHGDDVRIRQVLVNILTNAVKYTEKGTVTLRIERLTLGETVNLRFSVKDTGIGIKEEDISKLFEQFERIEEVRNRHVEGTGLGMPITKKLLDMMGASLEVESEYGVGSTFYFELEQGVVNPEGIGDISARMAMVAADYQYEAYFTAPDAKILVVDDNQTNLMVITNLLKETKVKVDVASSGKEALKLLEDTKYDLLFLDHMMPDMDGIELLNKILEQETEQENKTPKIALTANAIVGAKEKYLEAGFQGYLSKPIIPEKLEKMMMKFLPEEKVIISTGVNTQDSMKEQPEENLPQIEGVDWNYAKLHLGSEAEILKTLKVVYEAMELDAEELEEYYEQMLRQENATEAISRFRIKVHSVKSNAILLGILPLAGTAATLEYAARDGKIDKIKDMAPYFFNDLRGYREQLKTNVFKELEGKEKEALDKEEVLSQIVQLEECMEAFDVHGADDALEKIKAYAYNEEIENTLDRLSGAVSNLDVDKTKLYSDQFKKQVENL